MQSLVHTYLPEILTLSCKFVCQGWIHIYVDIQKQHSCTLMSDVVGWKTQTRLQEKLTDRRTYRVRPQVIYP